MPAAHVVRSDRSTELDSRAAGPEFSQAQLVFDAHDPGDATVYAPPLHASSAAMVMAKAAPSSRSLVERVIGMVHSSQFSSTFRRSSQLSTYPDGSRDSLR